MKLTNAIRETMVKKIITEKYGDRLNEVNKLFLAAMNIGNNPRKCYELVQKIINADARKFIKGV